MHLTEGSTIEAMIINIDRKNRSIALSIKARETVDTAEADFNQLGIGMRGYVDFGVNLQEFRAGVRSAGS